MERRTGSRRRLLVSASLLLAAGACSAHQGWVVMADPRDWSGIVSPALDLREPGELSWSIPPTPWDPRRGEAELTLATGYDWRLVPMDDVDCAMRVSIREHATGTRTEERLGTAELRWGEAHLGSWNLASGLDVGLVVEQTAPELGSGCFWVMGSYEQDIHAMDFVRKGMQIMACVMLALAAILALLAGRATQHSVQ
jgi:hypothetical protein